MVVVVVVTERQGWACALSIEHLPSDEERSAAGEVVTGQHCLEITGLVPCS